MTVTQTLRGLLRRWYILVVGLVVAVAVAAGVWTAVPPTYTRTSTQILLPGSGMIPSGSNPYLFVGGLAPAADIIVRGLGSKNVIEEVVRGRAGTTVQVARDQTTSGPVILITVESTSDRDAAAALAAMNQRTATLLDSLQAEENIPERRRISVVAVSVDKRGTAEQKQRLMMTGASGAAILVLTVLLASFVDGAMARRRARRAEDADGESSTDEEAGEASGSDEDGATDEASAVSGSNESDNSGEIDEDSRAPEQTRSRAEDVADLHDSGEADSERGPVAPESTDRDSSTSRSAASPVDSTDDADLPDRRGDRGERAPIG